MSGLTKDHVTILAIALEAPFCGFPVGSNLWPLTEFDGNDKGAIEGEVIEELLRGGLLASRPLGKTIPGERSPNHDFAPDLDFEHEVFITDTGREALIRSRTPDKAKEEGL